MRRLLSITLIAFLSNACVSHAANIRIWPKLTAVLNEDFTVVDPSVIISGSPVVVLMPRPEKYVAQVDVLMTIDDLQAGQAGFGNAAFDVAWGENFAKSVGVPGWAPVTTLDVNGDLPGGKVIPKWDEECDCGPDATDLQDIFFGIAPEKFTGESDPKRRLGMTPFNNDPRGVHPEGEHVGTFFLELNGQSPSGSIDLVSTSGAVFTPNLVFSTQNVVTSGGTIVFGLPEPSSFALLGLGSALLAFAGKRR